jgi:diguanylate cyclase (GGDEF)-like protein
VNSAGATQAAPRLPHGELLYGSVLFASALLALALRWPESALGLTDWHRIGFFLLFGLFTISIGYTQPALGYVSFDRVAQVSSILLLGPVDAAWINGLASLIYPWQRLRNGVPLRSVLQASLTNAGLMSLMILVGGTVYIALGGPVPLAYLSIETFAAVLAAMLVMQLINEAGMMTLAWIRGDPLTSSLAMFDTLTELTAGLVGVVVAIVWTRMEASVLMLVLAVLVAGMLALKRFAEMRLRLERLVEERTAALNDKTLQLERLAMQDTLTGLYNRRHADGFLARELDRAVGSDLPFSIALADVDNFKRINDAHSHGVGDRVLERVAEIMAEHVRDSDLVARYGGEEFLLCFLGTDEATAVALCERLRGAVERERWSRYSSGLQVTLSIGIAARRHETTTVALLHHADVCLYRAKNQGRNRVVSRPERENNTMRDAALGRTST